MCSLLSNTSVKWPLNSSSFSNSDFAKPLPFLPFKERKPYLSFFLLLMYRYKSLDLAVIPSTKIFTYKSCCFFTSALIFLPKDSNVDLNLLLPVFVALGVVGWCNGPG